MEVYQMASIAGILLLAGTMHSITGFGFSIYCMCVLPHIMPSYVQASAVASILSIVNSASLSYVLRKHINHRLVWWPLASYLVASGVCIILVTHQPDSLLKRLLGGFFIALALYFILVGSDLKIKPSAKNGLISGFLCGVLAGFFAMGSPPMAVYMLSVCESQAVYMATIQFFFFVGGSYSCAMRFLNGHVTQTVWLACAVGLPATLLGSYIGQKVRGKLDAAKLRKVTYGFMAVAGLLMILWG